MRIGPMVAALARAHGLSQGELADVIGVHRNRLRDKLAGRLEFKETEILALAEHFGVPPGHLFQDPVALLTSRSTWVRIFAGQNGFALAA